MVIIIGRKRNDQDKRTTVIFVKIPWDIYHLLESEGVVDVVIRGILESYAENRKKDIDRFEIKE
jgi:hypothetical protein